MSVSIKSYALPTANSEVDQTEYRTSYSGFKFAELEMSMTVYC